MTRNASFIRKVVYISLMALLLIPLSYLSQPSGADVAKHPGGQLDKLRHKYDLSLSSLGEIDPTSETMKFATLGMRGVACAILWQQRDEHKMKQNWEAYAAANNQIAKLQPHFIGVWTFTSWDESYNVSVEFDDYRMRYHWVKKGIDHVIEGTRYNRHSPKLMADLAWVFGHKVGRSDERVQFRREFKKDADFHASLPIDYNDPNVRVRDWEGKIDNWLVSREFYLRAVRIADSPGASAELGNRNIVRDNDPRTKLGQGKVIFYSNPAMASMNYADNVEVDGYFGDQARTAWSDAYNEWDDYGERFIPTSIEGLSIRLNYLEDAQERAKKIRDELDGMVADKREQMRKKRVAKLPEDQRLAYETPADERTIEQQGLAATAEREVEVSYVEAAEQIADQKDNVYRLALQLQDLEQRARYIASYRNIVNFDYWKTRAEAEQTQEMIVAKRDVYEGKKLFDEAILEEYTEMVYDRDQRKEVPVKRPGAKEKYENAFEKWKYIFSKYPVMIDNPETEDLVEHVNHYREVLGNLDEDFPSDFPLQVILDMYDELGQRRPNSAQVAEQWVARINDPRYARPQPPRLPGDETAAPKASADPRQAKPHPPVAPDA